MTPVEHFLHWVPGPRGARTLLPNHPMGVLHPAASQQHPVYPQPPLQPEFHPAPQPTSGMEE